MNTGDRALRPNVEIGVVYRDDTPIGAALSPRLQASLRNLYRPISRASLRYGPRFVVEHSERILDAVWKQPCFGALWKDSDRNLLAESILYPDARLVRPESIVLSDGDTGKGLRLEVRGEQLAGLHDLIATLAGDPDAILSPSAITRNRRLVQRLELAGMLQGSATETEVPRDSVTFVGHNTVVCRTRETTIVLDPWLPPRGIRYSGTYQPFRRVELGRVHAILITHSHPDHFDPGTLLQFAPTIPILVPTTHRESLLSSNLHLRLRELGFLDVRTVSQWSETDIGDIRVIALPFFGEQPTTTEQRHPEVRNEGNTYLVLAKALSCAFVADAGRDRLGNVCGVAAAAYRRWGAIDALFSGFRGWKLYPVEYFGSSVSQYLLFVPRASWSVRQAIMSDATDAIDTAEAWHARYLIPYGNGGAPWYWQNGLGPNASTKWAWQTFDPLPERCVLELRHRSQPVRGVAAASGVSPLLLRPGQAARFTSHGATITHLNGHRWPARWSSRREKERKA